MRPGYDSARLLLNCVDYGPSYRSPALELGTLNYLRHQRSVKTGSTKAAVAGLRALQEAQEASKVLLRLDWRPQGAPLQPGLSCANLCETSRRGRARLQASVADP